VKIGIDARIIFRRGVGRYISNLVKALLEIDKKNSYFIYLDKKSMLVDYINAKNCVFRRINTSNAFMYEQFFLPAAAKKDKVDILHGTDNTIPVFFRGKTAVTIHDTMFIRPISRTILKPTMKQRVTDAYNKSAIPASAKKADRVITVSEYSRQDILKNIKIGGDKVRVIGEGVEEKYKVIKNEKRIKKVKEKFGIIKPYIMISAASDLRKNTIRAIEAFNIFNNLTEYKYQLVITSIGAKELATTNIRRKISELNLEKYVIITDYVTDEDMVLLYNGGFCLLFPSIWEGFGLQVLEAFACGLPVITSDNTSLKETAGDAAFFIDPFSVEDIVRGMTSLASAPARRRSMVSKGFKQLKNFSWKEAAKETLKVYEEAVNNTND